MVALNLYIYFVLHSQGAHAFSEIKIRPLYYLVIPRFVKKNETCLSIRNIQQDIRGFNKVLLMLKLI